MAHFICALLLDASADRDAPHALAFFEQTSGRGVGRATYHLRDLRRLDGDDATAVANELAEDSAYAGQTTVVVGGTDADALDLEGMTTVPVVLTETGGHGADGRRITVSKQVLVDTFERVYRDGSVQSNAPQEAASEAIAALYTAADLDNAADEPTTERADDGTILAEPNGGPAATVVEQSGSAEGVSTEEVDARGDDPDDHTALATAQARERVGRVAAGTGEAAPDLGDHAPVALAAALGVFYGEYAADRLPTTEQAGRIADKRERRAAAS